MSSDEGPTVVFEPWSRKASIAGSSYIVQIGKVDDYWSIAIFRGNDLISVKKVGTLDPNVLTSIISSSISLPLISPYSIVRSLGNIINEAKVRKYPLTYTPSPEGEQPTAPAPSPAPVYTPAPSPASAHEAAPAKISDFESRTGFKRMTTPEVTEKEDTGAFYESTPESTESQVEEETNEKELTEVGKSKDVLGSFASGNDKAFSSMFEEEEGPAKPMIHKAGTKSIEIPELQPLEKWQRGVSGLSFFLDIAISFMKSKHSKDLSKLWQYYLEVESRNWKAAKGRKFEEVVGILVNIERATGSEIEVQEFTESTFKAKVSKCLGKNYKQKYGSVLPLPDEFPCVLCKIRGESISRNLGYSFDMIETPQGCQIQMSASPKKEKLVI
ncbi:MAG: hypothetical protein WED07_11200 [Candidatus Freyarchaeum deiterrae]